MAQLLTTEGVDPRDRLAYWRDVVCKTFIKLEVAAATPSRFRGTVTIDNAGPVQITRLRTDPMVARRTRSHVRLLEEEMCLLVVQLHGRTLAGQDGRTASLGRGDVALFDSIRPYTVDFRGDDFDHLVLQFPRHLFTERAVVPQDVTARAITGTSAVGQLLFPFVVSVARAADSAAPETSARLGEMLLDLLASALSGEARSGEARPGNDFELLQRIQLYAHAHLSDPTLSPGKAAAATHTSLRQLHRVFAAQGTSFSRWVRTERLRRCYEDLSAAGHSGLSISAVGRRWGFNDLPTMSKAFRSEYGLSPREYRKSAG